MAVATVIQIGEVGVVLTRSARRRTLGLQVRGGVATARAPAAMPEAKIVAFLQSKHHWLAKHVRAQQQVTQPAPLSLGESVSFLGESLLLRPDPQVRAVRREANHLIVPAEDWAEPLKAWTKQAALAPYTQLVEDYAAQLGAAHKLRSVRVSDTRSRWGSCTASGDIRLHWALSRAPMPVLRYVALHEAAHLLELNHSARYWRHVTNIMPEHAKHRAWLREFGRQLL